MTSEESTPFSSLPIIAVWLLTYNGVWFACVLGAGAGYPLLGAVAMVAWGVAFAFLGAGPGWRVSMKNALLCAVVGYVVDSAMTLSGVIDFPAHSKLGGPSPIWMVALWFALGAAINDGLGRLDGRWWLLAVLGAIGGAACYLGGARMECLILPQGTQTAAVVIGLAWALALPLLVRITRQSEHEST